MTTRQDLSVRECAELCGVTVKALRHYEKLRLLAPARTPAGHRRYSARDVDRVRRILALKRVGMTLPQMRSLLDADPATLLAHVAASRETLAKKQARLSETDRALALVEESLRQAPADRAGLSRLADVLDMPREVDWMQRYFSDEAWPVARRFYQDWPTEPWITLYREIVAAIPEGPGTAQARALVHRWNALAEVLWREFTSDAHVSRQLHEGFARAWRDRAHWPEKIARRFADYRMDEVAAFLRDASRAKLERPA